MRTIWVFALCVWMMSLSLQAEASCGKMAKKICKALGKKAFLCKAYTAIAKDPQISHKRCRGWMKKKWGQRLAIWRRSESTLKRMEALGKRSGAGAVRKVKRYKRVWVSCRRAELRKNAPPNPPECRALATFYGNTKRSMKADPKACKKLAAYACRDLGSKSFYCAIFTRLSRSKTIKVRKCQLIVSLWNKSQRASYQKRTQALRSMARMARKNPAYRKQLKQLKQQEAVRLYRFLHF